MTKQPTELALGKNERHILRVLQAQGGHGVTRDFRVTNAHSALRSLERRGLVDDLGLVPVGLRGAGVRAWRLANAFVVEDSHVR